MKITKLLLIFVSLFTLGIPPVFAQSLSILPQASPTADCPTLLSIYELNGKIPPRNLVTAQQGLNAQANYQKASSAYEAATASYDQAQKDYLADTKDKNKEKAAQEAKKKVEETEAVKNQTSQESTAATNKAIENADNKTPEPKNDLLGCAIKTGRISLQMVPFFVTYIADFVLSLIGLLCVLFIVIGGYQYIVGGLTDQKEKGKNTIKHALMGMSIAILSWVIVTAVVNAITG